MDTYPNTSVIDRRPQGSPWLPGLIEDVSCTWPLPICSPIIARLHGVLTSSSASPAAAGHPGVPTRLRAWPRAGAAATAGAGLAPALQLSLRGTSCIYQGEELGLPESAVAYADMQDPYGITMWPEFKGRDGCRTPMAWDSTAADLGFGSGERRAWLPLDDAHRPYAVDRQQAQAGSLLRYYRHLLHWRRGQPALIHGDMELWPVHDQVLAYVRSHGKHRVLCAFNLSGRHATLPLPPGIAAPTILEDSVVTGASVSAVALAFEPWGALYARLA